MASTADLRVGAFLKYNGELCQVLESEHRTPGNLRAFYQVKLRVLRTSKLLENRYRSGETIEFVRVEKRDFQYLYRDGDSYVFMDTSNYDQIPVDSTIVGNVAKLMKENQEVQLTFDEVSVLNVELPSHVQLRVVHTEPGVRGDTATNVLKPATVETGIEVAVPLFIKQDEVILVDTRDGSYQGRAS